VARRAPAAGRYREFYQADIDVIGEGELPVHFDAEMALLLHEVVSSLPIPKIQLRINNRKVLEGFYRSLGITEIGDVLRSVDKLDKIGEDGVRKALIEENGLAAQVPTSAWPSRASAAGQGSRRGGARARPDPRDSRAGPRGAGFVMSALEGLPEGAAIADLHIARGLDYYTGTVYEGVFVDEPKLGAVARAALRQPRFGRQAQAAGVGVSLGISRILGFMFAKGALKASRPSPTAVLVALPTRGPPALLRARPRAARPGIATEVFYAPRSTASRSAMPRRRASRSCCFRRRHHRAARHP
jgi:histidyl-tRNA synthetase